MDEAKRRRWEYVWAHADEIAAELYRRRAERTWIEGLASERAASESNPK